MERQPAPEVTIEGGPGWQLDGGRPPGQPAASDAVAADDYAAPSDRARGPWPLVLAAALGFSAATVLAEVRQETLAESAQGVLSIELRPEPENIGRSLTTTSDGALAVTTSAVLRNTGPEPIALERLELVGTTYRSDDLAGRRLAPDQQSVVALLRPVDCERLERTRAPGPLRVHATTGAGSRSVDLRLSTDVLTFHDEQVRAACGQSDPTMSLIALERPVRVEGRTAVVPAELSNGSARPLAVREVRTVAGLRVVGLQDEQGRPLTLPLALPPGDFDPPVDVFEGRGTARVVSVLLEVADCDRLADDRSPHLYVPVVEAFVESEDSPTGATSWGADPTVLDRLVAASCPAG